MIKQKTQQLQQQCIIQLPSLQDTDNQMIYQGNNFCSTLQFQSSQQALSLKTEEDFKQSKSNQIAPCHINNKQSVEINQENNNQQNLIGKGEETSKQKIVDFNCNTNFISRFFLIDLIKLLIKSIKDIRKFKQLTISNVPQMLPSQQVNTIYQQSVQNLEMMKQKVAKNKKELTSSDMIMVLLKTLRKELILCFLFLSIQLVFRIFQSLIMALLLQSILDNGNSSEAYLYAIGMNLSFYIQFLFWNNSMKYTSIIVSKIRIIFLKTLYSKILKLSSFAVKQANLGKLVSLISNDLNTLEMRAIYIVLLLLTPIYILTIGLLLVYRFGELGLIGLVFMLLNCLIQLFFSKLNQKYFTEKTNYVDKRISLTNEIIEGIRLIKIYAWEEAFQHTIGVFRKMELLYTLKQVCVGFVDSALANSSAVIGSFLSFYFIYFYGDQNTLNVSTIFSSLDLLQFVKQSSITIFGPGFSGLFEMKVIMKRFLDIVTLEESCAKCIEGTNELEGKSLEKGCIEFNNFYAYWVQNQPILSNINFSINPNECVCVLGKVGSGKSTLLSCMLKEIPYFKGNFKLNGKIAFVEQEPYIFNQTLKENIIFGREYNEELYTKILKDSCLLEDIEQLANGDQILIGEKGQNLSGGQKARISLARAMYTQADIYLFDDPLSAVDSKVAKKLFQKTILKLKQTSTVVLVTHQQYFSSYADKIIVLESGQIKFQGSYQNFKEYIQIKANNSNEEEDYENSSENQDFMQDLSFEIEDLPFNIENTSKVSINLDSNSKKEESLSDYDGEKKQNKQTEKENESLKKQGNQKSNVNYKIYLRYFKMSNIYLTWPLVILLYASNDTIFVLYNKILGSLNISDSDECDKSMNTLMLLIIGYVSLQILKRIFLSININSIARNLHSKMIQSLLRSKVSFFDTTQSGDIINRFSSDLGSIDYNINIILQDSLEAFITQVVLLAVNTYYSPFFGLVAVSLMVILYFFAKICKDSLQSTKKLDILNKSPLFSFFNSSTQGILPIKVFNQIQAFQNKFDLLIENSFRSSCYSLLVQRSFTGLIQMISCLTNTFGIIIILSTTSSHSQISESIILFLAASEILQRGMKQIIQLDICMANVQRCYNIIDIPQEPPLATQYDNMFIENQKDKNDNEFNKLLIFPKNGCVEFKNVMMKYNKNLEPVLRDLQFSIKQGEKVGFVGRTGAGKSSIIQALFRMVEIENNCLQEQPKEEGIFIDGHNIKNIGLHTLRKGISIIPQMPFIFQGTVRSNLDPLNNYTDFQIENVLKDIGLYDKVITLPLKMQSKLSNSSQIFSIGEKQLICLGRVILRQSKIIVLDEATANCDMNTDELIQKLIREKFQQSTIITIAHRLNTIADYDKIIVMGSGRVIEQGSPYDLLQANGVFYQMVQNTGKQNSRTIHKLSSTYIQTLTQIDLDN